MSLRPAIGAVVASVVVLAGTGCDSGSDAASPTGGQPAATAPPPQEQTTGEAATPTDAATETTGRPSDTTGTQPTSTTGTPTRTTATTPAEPRYSLGPTRRCLVRTGLQVGKVGDSDSRLRALGDLAQRTSLEIHADGDVVGLAITDVELLADLLAVPNDPYRIETHGNALLMFQPASRALARRVRECLRG